ncbi:hypothetical protein SKAU_G00160230 [Synaphobranchus kaupii]|uniref:PurM-like N-terminal domain-containing protein n=1 Tax=Synaphobranchus kaupii TaxID=118154 RepID=A0A9Q1FIC9_SYNKA|nr:hypothetical protein SKAU_G00160230 [Synaphobranchus kaupii]
MRFSASLPEHSNKRFITSHFIETYNREALLKLLQGLEPDRPAPVTGEDGGDEASEYGQLTPVPHGPRLGIGMDSCVIPIRHGGLSLVQTTDFFYPLVEDPYMMGRIGCANVLSDLYAMGVTECDNMLMLLSVSQKMSDKEREKVMPLMMQGFRDAAEEGGTSSCASPKTSLCRTARFRVTYWYSLNHWERKWQSTPISGWTFLINGIKSAGGIERGG